MARESGSVNPETLKDAFKRAAEIAEVVPATMQEAAFHRALDQILGGGELVRQTTSRGAGTAKTEDAASGADPAKQLIEGINRTAVGFVNSVVADFQGNPEPTGGISACMAGGRWKPGSRVHERSPAISHSR
jgi:hypothetical protein